MQSALAPYTAHTDQIALPPPLDKLEKPLLVNFTWSAAERKVCRKRKDISTSDLAEKIRVLTAKDSPDREGSWQNSVTPYLVGPMDAVFFSSVRQVVICAPPQTAKSECCNNIIAKIIDRVPGPVLIIYPNEKDAKKNIKRRVLGMIKESPQLSSYLTGYKEDEASALIDLSHMRIRAGWAGSAQSLASSVEKYVFYEETDKYNETVNTRETGVFGLGDKRTRTVRGNEKQIKVSTPTLENGLIWQALTKDSEVIFEYVVRCPDCRKTQTMDLGSKETTHGLKWPADQRDHKVIESKDLASYHCEHCDSVWNDYLRDLAVTHGYWRDKKTHLTLNTYLEKHRPKKIGFHWNALISTFVPLSEYAAAFVKGLSSKNDLKDYLNGYAAEPWLHYTKERDEDKLLTLCDQRPPGLVPGGNRVAGLFAGVDTHGPGVSAGFYFVIRAYGWAHEWLLDERGNLELDANHNPRLVEIPQEKWLIRKGFVKTFSALEQILIHDKYTDPDGNIYPIQKVVQDAMGGRTKEVYDFSRKYRGWLFPFQGMQKMAKMWRISPQDNYPGTNKPIPGGVQLLQGNTTLYKSALATDLEVAPGDPGCRWLHASVSTLIEAGHKNPSAGIDFDYVRHLTSEYVDEKGHWQKISGRANEFWDCEEYSDIAADVSQVTMWTPPQPLSSAPHQPKSRILSKGVEV